LPVTFNDGPARCGAVLFLSAIASIAQAGELTIDAAPCAEQIRIHARDVPLGDIVGQLSATMGVRLVARVQLPELVSLDVAGAPEDVLKRVLHGKNLVTESKSVAACGARQVLATIWLLPAGEEGKSAPQTEEPRVEKAGEQPAFRTYDRNKGNARPARKAGRPRAAEEDEKPSETAPER
jgi:hypothetical protein